MESRRIRSRRDERAPLARRARLRSPRPFPPSRLKSTRDEIIIIIITSPSPSPSPSSPPPTDSPSIRSPSQTVMAAFGTGGYVLVCTYFVLGSAVTKLKLEQKQREGIAEARSGRRGVGSVWGSGVAGLCAVCALAGVPPGADLWRLGFVASFCSKLSDTTASEVGKAYGRTTYMSVPSVQVRAEGHEGRGERRRHARGVGRQPRVRGRGCRRRANGRPRRRRRYLLRLRRHHPRELVGRHHARPRRVSSGSRTTS